MAKYSPDWQLAIPPQPIVDRDVNRLHPVARSVLKCRGLDDAVRRRSARLTFRQPAGQSHRTCSSLPAWLDGRAYSKKIQPLLSGVANPVIMSALGVLVAYAVAIRAWRT